MDGKPSIQIYADRVISTSEYQTHSVWMEGVDYSAILAEIPTQDVINYILENYHSDYLDAVKEAEE